VRDGASCGLGLFLEEPVKEGELIAGTSVELQ
jgi:hypothetical protein